MLVLLVTCLALFSFFVYRFHRVYKEQADSHLSDVTALSASNISGMIEQIDQLSVSVLIETEKSWRCRCSMTFSSRRRLLYTGETMEGEQTLAAFGTGVFEVL